MCLAIPSKITKIKNGVATIDVEGIKRKCSLMLLENSKIGDYVIVHAGFAMHKIDKDKAKESINFLREAASLVKSKEKENKKI